MQLLILWITIWFSDPKAYALCLLLTDGSPLLSLGPRVPRGVPGTGAVRYGC